MIRQKVLMPILLVALVVVGCATSPSPEPSQEAKTDKVLIGALDFEGSAAAVISERPEETKKALMKELKKNTRVKLVDIPESCGLSDLKRNGYERAEKYKVNYQLDMILHVSQVYGPPPVNWNYYFSLIDLYTKQVKKVSIKTAWDTPIELRFSGVSKKLLRNKDLNRVLREKKKP